MQASPAVGGGGLYGAEGAPSGSSHASAGRHVDRGEVAPLIASADRRQDRGASGNCRGGVGLITHRRLSIWAATVQLCNTTTDGLDHHLRLHVFHGLLTRNSPGNDLTNPLKLTDKTHSRVSADV